MPGSDATTFLDALVAALTHQCAHNSAAEVGPVALLWPDQGEEWAPLLPRLRERMTVLTLGRYDPDAGTGPVAWLRFSVESATVTLPGAMPVPVLYLPGISASALRELDERNGGSQLAILAGLRHRAAVWTRPDRREWTVAAFLTQPPPGLDIELRPGEETATALCRALPLLAAVPLARLREEAPWRATDFDALAGHPPISSEPSIAALIAAGESATVEFKSTIRWDVDLSRENKELELMITKTVAAFLNAEGGTLLIGVADDGTIYGLDRDYQSITRQPRNRDKLERHLMTLFRNHFGDALAVYTRVRFHEIDGQDVCRVSVSPAPEPAFVQAKSGEELYVRFGNATRSLGLRETIRYVRNHWG